MTLQYRHEPLYKTSQRPYPSAVSEFSGIENPAPALCQSGLFRLSSLWKTKYL